MKRLSVHCIYKFISPAFLLAFIIVSPSMVNALDLRLSDLSRSDEPPARGDSSMAERYALWARDTIDQGKWAEALAGLERASDFSNVSSDISYMLALARYNEKKPLGSVLAALEHGLAVDRWNVYNAETARLMKADMLIRIRAYPDALVELSKVNSSPAQAELTLKALSVIRPAEFLSFLTDTLDRYPRESGPVRIYLSYLKKLDAEGRNPSQGELEPLGLILRRLPVLLLNDQELAWMAAPFMRDTAEAKLLVSAYRSVNDPAPASLPVALNLGIIDEETALEELFGKTSLDMALLSDVWKLLRREEARSIFRRNLLAYTGVITEDSDSDGIPETSAVYNNGILVSSEYNILQDGVPDLTVYYEAGDPKRALTFVAPGTADKSGLEGRPISAGGKGETSDTAKATVEWERFPAVLDAELNGVRYIPRPFEFNFSPFKFIELWGSGVLFPQRDRLSPPLTRRLLVMQSFRIERPSLEFKGGTEEVELSQGIPMVAYEYVGGLKVSETEFLRGRPQLQRVDLDLDGHFDTVRFFSRNYPPAELEDLWNYDRNIDHIVTIDEKP